MDEEAEYAKIGMTVICPACASEKAQLIDVQVDWQHRDPTWNSTRGEYEPHRPYIGTIRCYECGCTLKIVTPPAVVDSIHIKVQKNPRKGQQQFEFEEAAVDKHITDNRFKKDNK